MSLGKVQGEVKLETGEARRVKSTCKEMEAEQGEQSERFSPLSLVPTTGWALESPTWRAFYKYRH